MKCFKLWALSLLCVAWGLSGYASPAGADLRFCNQTSTAGKVVEGHVIPKTGLTVTGSVTVPAGKCGVVIPGRLTAPTYFVHVDEAGMSYGGGAHLCVKNMSSFKIEAEDARGFRCDPNAWPHLVIEGISVHDELENFFRIDMYGSTTLILTMRKDKSFHYNKN